MRYPLMRQVVISQLLLAMGLLVGCNSSQPKAAEFWGAFPANSDPKVLGKRVVNNLLTRQVIESRDYGVIYPEVCVSYGSLRFANAIDDKQLIAAVIDRYKGMLLATAPTAPATSPAPQQQQQAAADAAPASQPAGGRRGGRGGRGGGGGGGGRGGPQGITPAMSWSGNMIPGATHVDRSVFGTLPLEIYQLTGDKRYLAIGKKSADDQWANPIEGGLTNQSRWWIDDMFMISAVQANAYRATKDKVYLDHLATQMAAYLDKLQQPNGLFHHADDVPAYWGRGCGWVAAGLTELLTDLPKDHPKYARIMDGYQKMMAALLKYQGADGMWHQLLDKADSWPETSGSGMFTFAMATGVRRGWLDAATYKEPARKSWIALSSYLNENGQVREVCIGTNKYPNMQQSPDGMVAYYENRARNVGDLHGQAAFIWAAWAVAN